MQNEFDDISTPASPYPPKEPIPNPSAQTYEYGQPPRKRSPKKLLLLAVGAILAIVVILNVLRLLGSNDETQAPTPTPTIEDFAPEPEATIEPTDEPTPTPVSSVDRATGLDRADLSVIVQNGSGTAGAAGDAADLLRDLGYNVVSTGNADNFDYEDVTIRVKSSQKNYLSLLNKDLSSEYTVAATSSDLSATSSADALVIIGK